MALLRKLDSADGLANNGLGLPWRHRAGNTKTHQLGDGKPGSDSWRLLEHGTATPQLGRRKPAQGLPVQPNRAAKQQAVLAHTVAQETPLVSWGQVHWLMASASVPWV